MTERSDRLGLAIGVLLFTVFALSLGDALIKRISTGFGLWQLFALRSALLLPVLAVVGVFIAGNRLWPRKPGWVFLRSGLLVANWIAYYTSLPFLNLAVAAAVLYTLPMFITLFSAIWLDERLTRAGLLSVALGFLGVLVILRPDTSGVNAAVLLPLLGAMLYALAMVVTRAKCRDEHPLSLALALNLGFMTAGLTGLAIVTVLAPVQTGFLNAGWVAMTQPEWSAMALLACSILIGSIGTAIAYQNGPASVLGVFDFAYVGFAVIWGVLIFGELPDAGQILGIALIIMAGLIAARR